jgi:hypothetical protein
MGMTCVADHRKASELQPINKLEKLRDMALQKLGSNIFNFGLAEQCLKYLVLVSDVTTTATATGVAFDSKTVKKIDKLQKMMLGQLINDILEKWRPDSLSTSHQIQDLFDTRISTSLRVEMSRDGYDLVKKSYEEMVEDRNYLVHQFSKAFPLNTTENCHEAASYLDELREKHRPTIINLQEIVKTHFELANETNQLNENNQLFAE